MSWWGFRRSLLLALSSVFVVIGCSSNSSDSSASPELPTYDTTHSFKRELENASLYCATVECESNKSDFESIGLVGMVVEGSVTSYWRKMSQCTGFLYGANNIVALNSHCISDSMWEQKNNCGGVLAIKFPEVNGKPSEVRNCVEILYRSKVNYHSKLNVEQDFAFFRIEPIQRTPLKLSTDGSPNKQLITVRKVNPLSSFSSLGGSLDYAYCQSQTESFLNVDALDTWSDTGLGVQTSNQYKSCKIIKGNSGSPVLNARGEIIGIAQSYWTPEFLRNLNSDEFKKAYSKASKIEVELDFPYSMPDHFHYTQVACLPNPKLVQDGNTFCKLRATPRSAQQIILSSFENAATIEEYSEKIKKETLSNYPAFFQYDLVKEEDRQAYSIRPICLLNSQKWSVNAINSSRSNMRASPQTIRTNALPTSIEFKITVKMDANFAVSSKRISHTLAKNKEFLTTVSSTKQLTVESVCHDCSYWGGAAEKIENLNWCAN